MDSVGDQRKRAEDLVAPAHPPAHAHGRAHELRGDEAAPASPAQPGERVIEGGAELGKVDQSLLDPGPRRRPGRMPDGVDPAGAVDGYARRKLMPLTRGDPDALVVADAHVDDPAGPVGQAVQLSRRVMAER